MPIVNVKGVANQMQFPDDMDINDIRTFLQKKFTQRAVGGQSDALSPQDNIAAPYKPSLMERAGQGVADVLSNTGIISNRYGAQQIGKNVAAIGEMLPGIGDVAAVDDFSRAAASGDKLGMGLAALGVLPAGDLAKNTLKVKFPKFKIGLSENADNIILDKVVVPDELRNSGQGTEFMVQLIGDADKKGKTIGLTPSPDFGGNKKRLTEFYKRFGFVENKGKNKDFTISESMIRESREFPIKNTNAKAIKQTNQILPMDDAASSIKPARPTGKPIMDEAGNAKFIEGDDGKFFKLHKRSGDWVDITGTVGEANAKAEKAKGLTPNADKSPAQYRAESAAQAEGYKMQHTAPLKSDGNPSGVNVEDAFPGMYSGHSSDYLTGVSYDDKAIRIIQGMKGKPEKSVTIYRAVPKDVKEINATDWITTTKEYAQDHMEGEKGWHILSKKVKAKDIATDGNSIHEFGYDPTN